MLEQPDFAIVELTNKKFLLVFLNIIFSDFTHGSKCESQCFSACGPQLCFMGLTCEACSQCRYLTRLHLLSQNLCGQDLGILLRFLQKHPGDSGTSCFGGLRESAPKVPLKHLFQSQPWFDPWQVVWETESSPEWTLTHSPKVFCSVEY